MRRLSVLLPSVLDLSIWRNPLFNAIARHPRPLAVPLLLRTRAISTVMPRKAAVSTAPAPAAASPQRKSSRSSSRAAVKSGADADAAAAPEPATTKVAQASPKKGKTKANEATEETADSKQPASKGKRKAGDDTAAEASAEEPGKSKKRKKKAEADPDAPVNPSAPTAEFHAEHGDAPSAEGIPRDTISLASKELKIEPRPEGQVRLVSWNITSFNSCEKKGLFKYLEAEQPDVVVLTETKVNDAPEMHPGLAPWPHRYWGIDSKTKGYAGTAVLSKIKPLKVTIGMAAAGSSSTKEYTGRIITLEFERHFLVGTYVTNAGEGLAKMSDKQAWNARFAAHMRELDAQKPIIWCGDLNAVIDQRDVAAAKKKWNKQPGYTQIECDAHRQLLAGEDRGTDRKLVDVWRQLHPDAIGHYSFYSFRGACRGKGIGWRLDSFIVSERALQDGFVKQCEIRHDVYGPSDHVPVVCDVQGPL